MECRSLFDDAGYKAVQFTPFHCSVGAGPGTVNVRSFGAQWKGRVNFHLQSCVMVGKCHTSMRRSH